MDSTMEVNVDSAIGMFSIGVNMWDTVLTMKKKIENTRRIPVSKQTLYFGSKVLDDHLGIMQCNIFNNSRLLLAISPDCNPNQNNNPLMVNDQVQPQNEPPLVMAKPYEEFLMNDSPETMEGKDHQQLQEIEKSFAEFIYTEDDLLSDISKIKSKENIQDQYPTTTDPTKQLTSNTSEEVKNDHQDSTKKRKKIPLNVLPFQDLRKVPVDVNSDDKVEKLREKMADLNQLKMFALPEGEYFFINKQDVLIDDRTFDENLVAPGDTIQILCGKFPVGRSNKNDSLRSNSSQQLRVTQGLPPIPAGNKGIKPKKSPKPVSVKRGIIITPDFPERKRRKRVEFTVMVQPFQEEPHKEETRKVEVKVSPDDNVEELREKLAKLKEKGELDLPEEGYFFIHKQCVLVENLTFEAYDVAPGDTIEIFRGKVTLCE